MKDTIALLRGGLISCRLDQYAAEQNVRGALARIDRGTETAEIVQEIVVIDAEIAALSERRDELIARYRRLRPASRGRRGRASA